MQIYKKMVKTKIDIKGTLEAMNVGDVVCLNHSVNSLRVAACLLNRRLGRRYKVNILKDTVQIRRYE